MMKLLKMLRTLVVYSGHTYRIKKKMKNNSALKLKCIHSSELNLSKVKMGMVHLVNQITKYSKMVISPQIFPSSL